MEETASLTWHSTYAILCPTTPSSRDLPGDKIILPHSALEALLAAAASQRASAASANHGTYFEEFLDPRHLPQLPSPLIFRLENPKNGNVVYAGVREFSAPEGLMGLSPLLLKALDIEPGDSIPQRGNNSQDEPTDLTAPIEHSAPLHLTVRVVSLPKGTYVRLRPLEAGYDPDNWKPLLERQLRQSFTSLTIHSALSVRGAQGEDFKLLVDKFVPEGDGICVVDTDLEVDIEALNEEQARETLRQRIARGQAVSDNGSSKGGELDIWKEVDGRVAPGDYVDYVLPSWDRSQVLSITLSGLDDETSLDLFVTPKTREQRALPRDSVHVFGDFTRASSGSKTIIITPSNVALEGAESILISVHAFLDPESTREPGSPMSYTIRARVGPVAGSSADREPVKVADEGRASDDDERCENCLQWVPKRTMMLHQNFCLRNNTVCPRCKSVFKKGSPEWQSHWHCEHDDAFGNSPASKAKHNHVLHAQHRCGGCEFSTNSLPDLARHRTGACPEKIILCRFCHLEVPQEGDPLNPSPEVLMSGMSAHELADGARTTECHLCEKIVRLRDMEAHLANHEWDKSYRSKPSICRNVNCGRTLWGIGPRGMVGSAAAPVTSPENHLGLCATCYGPLYVSLHDPDGSAMRRRIERRYLSQLLTGCQKPHCLNAWCKTGRKNQGLAPEQSPSSIVRPLIPEALDPKAPAYFCVDEKSQAARKAAEAVASERVWDVEWCIAAAEISGHQKDKMRDWLKGWAPKRVEE